MTAELTGTSRSGDPAEELSKAVERLVASLVIEAAYGLRPPSR
ncbi:hypothetical protein [Raineyella fluvialis]|nr:hypothetical protein [Raineyella fluvialis]